MPDTKLGRVDSYSVADAANPSAARLSKVRKEAMTGSDHDIGAVPDKIVEAAALGTRIGACIFCRYRTANRARLFGA